MLSDSIKSIIHFPFYREVPRKTLGQTAAYLAVLGVVFSISVVTALFINVRPRIDSAVLWAAESIPRLELSEGRLSSSAPGPVEVRHPDMPELSVVVDTGRTEPVTADEMTERKILIYLTADTVYVVNNRRMETYDLAKTRSNKPVVIDPDFFVMLGRTLKTVMYPVAFFTSLLIFFVWKHLAALVYSLLGLIISTFMNANLEFPALFKLAVYAQTPVIVLQIVSLFLPKIPFFGTIALILVGVYLWQAIRQILTPPEPAPPAAV